MKNKILQLPEHMFIVSHFIHWGYSNKGNTKREIIITCTKHFFFLHDVEHAVTPDLLKADEFFNGE